MRRVLTGYAVGVNRRHKRHGQLFQNRYNSIPAGVIRSAGGWTEVKESGRQGQGHVMSDKRVLGDSEFVENLPAQADAAFERLYELIRSLKVVCETGTSYILPVKQNIIKP